MKCLAEWPHLAAGYVIPGRGGGASALQQLQAAQPAMLCPRWRAGGNHTLELHGQLRATALLTARLQGSSETRTASPDSIGEEESGPEHSNH